MKDSYFVDNYSVAYALHWAYYPFLGFIEAALALCFFAMT
ncbi:hypothetical protein W04_3643 [Pseudoalteromonas sp. SW0106-04]|nr:hypothetical protein W04_3643 [Pseudoalteromonas sp. SW0106-04]